MTKNKFQNGFTIIELMIATVVFTIVMLILTVSVMHFTNSYYKGVTQASTQSVARNIVNSVAQAIQFSGDQFISKLPSNPLQPDSKGAYCVGGQLYSFKLGVEQESNPGAPNPQNVLVVSPDPGCSTTNISPNFATGTNAQGMLGSNMWLASFSIAPITAAPPSTAPINAVNATLYRISVRVLYGASGLLTNTIGNNSNCIGTTGSQFCATSGLSTIVEARIK